MERHKETKNEGGFLEKRKRRKDMKMRKKIIAGILAATMMFSMNMMAFAANDDGKPDNADTAVVSITNVTETPTVTLYQIAKAEYGTNGKEFIRYTWATDATFKNPNQPTSDEINKIAQGILNKAITPFETIKDGTLESGTYKATVSAGAYIAIISGSEDVKIYNPILLTATYDTTGNLQATAVDSGDDYLWGSTAVAKSSTPEVDKEITDGTTADGDKKTGSVGDVVDYKVTPTIPTYPSNATNKTFFISDRLSEGLTFDYSSLTVTIEGQTVTKTGDTFKLDNKTIATASNTNEGNPVNGFNLNFYYDALLIPDGDGAVYTPVVSYSAVINEKAVVGGIGNPNGVIYYYGIPNNGSTWTDVKDDPDKAKNVEKKEDTETVYTYQLAFLKTGEGVDDEGNPTTPGLADAVFGIYEDENCTKLIDKVTTNEKGYAVSTNVGAGDYWVKELVAPTGYSLNNQKFKITANWTTATTTVTGTVTDRTYTTEQPSKDAVQVGWIKDRVFYAMDEFTAATATAGGYEAAYLDSENTTTSTGVTVTINQGVGSGTAILGTSIPNTKLSTLPGTGGIGTTIFTIGGCAIMIAAAALFFAGRRKEKSN